MMAVAVAYRGEHFTVVGHVYEYACFKNRWALFAIEMKLTALFQHVRLTDYNWNHTEIVKVKNETQNTVGQQSALQMRKNSVDVNHSFENS